jgi:hypothetical protein
MPAFFVIRLFVLIQKLRNFRQPDFTDHKTRLNP